VSERGSALVIAQVIEQERSSAFIVGARFSKRSTRSRHHDLQLLRS
jgi:hypothetical protein